jgi:hypothetical protein
VDCVTKLGLSAETAIDFSSTPGAQTKSAIFDIWEAADEHARAFDRHLVQTVSDRPVEPARSHESRRLILYEKRGDDEVDVTHSAMNKIKELISGIELTLLDE